MKTDRDTGTVVNPDYMSLPERAVEASAKRLGKAEWRASENNRTSARKRFRGPSYRDGKN